MITYGILITLYLFCVWHGITIEIGTKISFEIYPARRLFNKETIHMNGKEYRAYIDNQKITTVKEEDLLNVEIEKDEKFYNDLRTAYENDTPAS